MIEERVNNVLSLLLSAVVARHEQVGHGNFCLASVVAGEEIAWDYGSPCDDGMIWTRLVSLQPPETSTEIAGNECFVELAATIEMGHLFAAPVADADGDLPDAHEHTEAAQRLVNSMDLALQALICTPLPGGESLTQLTYTPVGPSGGITGGVWTANLRVI